MSTAALLQDAPGFAHPERARWIEAFRRVRGETERRAAPLSPEDQVIQSMPDASPIKWHRAHTTWFFETFLVQPNNPDYETFDERFAFLFNSYYVAAGPRHARPKRGLITRPNAAEVADYRAHVDAAVERLIADASAAALPEIARILEIGLNHEEQHQELMLTDILHAFAQNPTAPGLRRELAAAAQPAAQDGYVDLPEGIHTIGHQGEDYCFDNERPGASRAGRAGAHRALARDQRRMARIHQGRRLRQPGAVALRRLGRGAERGLAGARPLAGPRRRMAPAHARGPAAGRSGRAGHACELLRGRRVRALGRQASADRSRSGRSRRAAGISPTPTASCGNGRVRATRPIRASSPATARSANTTASS